MVKLLSSYGAIKWDINEAVRTQISPDDIMATSETAKMLGRLIETLHESHCLTDEQMLQVIGGSWEIAK